MMLRRFLIALVMVGVAGCATEQVGPRAARDVPVDRILSAVAAGDARIVVVRDKGLFGGGCLTALYVNGQLVARVDAAESVARAVPAGDLLLAVGKDPQGAGLCALDKSLKVQREFSIRPGETKHFRIAIVSGALDVMRSDL